MKKKPAKKTVKKVAKKKNIKKVKTTSKKVMVQKIDVDQII